MPEPAAFVQRFLLAPQPGQPLAAGQLVEGLEARSPDLRLGRPAEPVAQEEAQSGAPEEKGERRH